MSISLLLSQPLYHTLWCCRHVVYVPAESCADLAAASLLFFLNFRTTGKTTMAANTTTPEQTANNIINNIINNQVIVIPFPLIWRTQAGLSQISHITLHVPAQLRHWASYLIKYIVRITPKLPTTLSHLLILSSRANYPFLGLPLPLLLSPLARTFSSSSLSKHNRPEICL